MTTNAGQDLRSVGITPGGLEGDIQTGEEMAGMAPPTGGETPVAPGAAPAAAPPAPAGAPPV